MAVEKKDIFELIKLKENEVNIAKVNIIKSLILLSGIDRNNPKFSIFLNANNLDKKNHEEFISFWKNLCTHVLDNNTLPPVSDLESIKKFKDKISKSVIWDLHFQTLKNIFSIVNHKYDLNGNAFLRITFELLNILTPCQFDLKKTKAQIRPYLSKYKKKKDNEICDADVDNLVRDFNSNTAKLLFTLIKIYSARSFPLIDHYDLSIINECKNYIYYITYGDDPILSNIPTIFNSYSYLLFCEVSRAPRAISMVDEKLESNANADKENDKNNENGESNKNAEINSSFNSVIFSNAPPGGLSLENNSEAESQKSSIKDEHQIESTNNYRLPDSNDDNNDSSVEVYIRDQKEILARFKR